MSTNSQKHHLLIVADEVPGFVSSLEARGVPWTLCDKASAVEVCLKQRLAARQFSGLVVLSSMSEEELKALQSRPILKRTPLLVLDEQSWALHSPNQAEEVALDLLLEIPKVRHSGISRSQKQVLVVDDVAVNRKLLGGYLKQLGHAALFAADGHEALKLLEETTPDLILMDVEMPGKNGLETTYELRGSAVAARDCPVLAVTGHSGPGERERCLAAGMDDVLVKPVTKKGLKNALEYWASKKLAHLRPSLPKTTETLPPVSLKQLQSDAGFDQTLLVSVIKSFLSEVEQGFAEVDRAIAEKDFEAICKWAHSVQGAASYFGAKRLEKLAQSLEVLGQESQMDLQKSIFASFLGEWVQVKTYLEQSLKMSGAVELEILTPLNLEPEQLNLIDMHSFLNIINVVAAELQNLEESVSETSDIQSCLDVMDDFSHQLKQPELVETALKNFSQVRERFWSCIGNLSPEDTIQSRSIFAASRENLNSIFAVIERRCADLLDRIHHPDSWEKQNIEDLLTNTKQMLAAVEKNAKGRYHIVYNIAAQEANDYLVHLDIKSVDGDGLMMPAVFVDVLRDLIANARKYTEPGGTIQAGLIDDGKHLRLAVEDNGRGIPAHELTRVVGFGYRASNVADKPTMGGGFGLTKAFWATKHFGGRMWIRSEVGQGTRITIQLPSHSQQGQGAEIPDSTRLAPMGQLEISAQPPA